MALFALCHGHAHGAELPAGIDAFAYIVGFTLTTVILHLAGITLGLWAQRHPYSDAGVRTAGGIVAATGAAILATAAI